MTKKHGWFRLSLVRRQIGFIAALSCTLAVLTVSVEAGQQRARLSKDLSDRLAARVEAPTDVIVAGSDGQIDALATRYGARVKKRLRNAAVLEVSGGQLRDLSEDAEVASLSGDVPVRAMATVTCRGDWRRSGVDGRVPGTSRIYGPRHRRGGDRHRRRREASVRGQPRARSAWTSPARSSSARAAGTRTATARTSPASSATSPPARTSST